MGLFGEPSRKEAWQYCFKKYGFSQIKPFHANTGLKVSSIGKISDGISRYLCKYVAKEAYDDDATWDFGGFLSGSIAEPGEIAAMTGIRRTDF